jgi:predicted HicB family RNase H-like nuclease
MTVKKLIKKQPVIQKNKEELIDQFIGGGGKTTQESSPPTQEPAIEPETRFTLRLPKSLDKMIESHRKSKVGNISKNTWILEAIHNRLEDKTS